MTVRLNTNTNRTLSISMNRRGEQAAQSADIDLAISEGDTRLTFGLEAPISRSKESLRALIDQEYEAFLRVLKDEELI